MARARTLSSVEVKSKVKGYLLPPKLTVGSGPHTCIELSSYVCTSVSQFGGLYIFASENSSFAPLIAYYPHDARGHAFSFNSEKFVV